MKDWHSATVHAGPYSWTATPTDDHDGDPKGLTSVNVQLARRDGQHPWMEQAEPMVCTFAVALDEPPVTSVPQLVKGSIVTAQVWRMAPGMQWESASVVQTLAPIWPGGAAGVGVEGTDDFSYYRMPPLALFYGRVTDLSVSWHSSGKLLLTVTAVDLTADLAQRQVGEQAWPAEPVGSRIERIMREADQPRLLTGNAPTFYEGVCVARAAGSIDALSILFETLIDASGFATYPGGQANLLGINSAWGAWRPTVGEDATEAGEYDWRTVDELATPADQTYGVTSVLQRAALMRTDDRMLPGVFENGPNGVRLVGALDVGVMPYAAGALHYVFDSAKVRDAGTWQAADAQPVDWIQQQFGEAGVGGYSSWYTRHPGATVPIIYARDSQLDTIAAVNAVGSALLPISSEYGWRVDRLQLVDLEPTDPVLPWLAGSWWHLYLQDELWRRPLVVTGIEPGRNPNGASIFAGVVVGAELDLRGSEWTYAVDVRAAVPAPLPQVSIYAGPLGEEIYLSYGNLATSATWGALTADDFDPTVTGDQLRIARRPLDAPFPYPDPEPPPA